MASFNDPKLNNHIADDVPAIRQLLRSVAALDPSTGNTDIPNGAKRLVETAQGYEFQSYNGTSWTTLEKWNIDVQKVDGYSASTGTTANTIPVRDANGKIPGDITGNADTATKANELSEVNPIAMGGTGAITAEQARNNLEVPPKGHASASTTYGVGTGGMYGHVKLSDYASDLYGVPEGIAATPLAVSNAQAEAVSEASAQLSSLDSTLRTLIAEEVAKYLPLEGGTMAGGILFNPAEQSGINAIRAASHAAGYLQFCGGMAYASGASLALYGFGHSTAPGWFMLNAQGDGVRSLLVGKPNGQFTWAGQNVARTVNGSTASDDGDVRVWAESKTGVNLNDITTDGTYYVSGEDLNIPSGSNGYLEVYSTSAGSAIRQIFYRVGTVNSNEHNIYTRARNASGTWGSWVKMLTSKDGVYSSSNGLLLNSTNVKIYTGASATLPSGGTWAVIGHSSGDGHDANIRGTFAGGTKVSMTDYGGVKFILALKIAV